MDVDPVDVSGRWYRHISDSPDGTPLDPLWLPGTTTGAARWQANSVVHAIYLADTIETMWAEWFRHLAENSLDQTEHLPRQVWAYDIQLAGVADLSSAARMKRVRLPAIPEPSRRSWPKYQAVGHGLFEAGHPGLLARSAALPRANILCIFRTDRTLTGLIDEPTYLGRQDAPPPVPTGMRT